MSYTFTIAEAIQDRFSAGAAPRSVAYRSGFEEVLHRLVDRASPKGCPYCEGSTEADAWFSGAEHAAEYCMARKIYIPY
jgi:hypothetical protein